MSNDKGTPVPDVDDTWAQGATASPISTPRGTSRRRRRNVGRRSHTEDRRSRRKTERPLGIGRMVAGLVRKRGFEPLRYCYRQPLKLVRLPVPPLPRGVIRSPLSRQRCQRLLEPRSSAEPSVYFSESGGNNQLGAFGRTPRMRERTSRTVQRRNSGFPRADRRRQLMEGH
jgi:hypothetical protein